MNALGIIKHESHLTILYHTLPSHDFGENAPEMFGIWPQNSNLGAYGECMLLVLALYKLAPPAELRGISMNKFVYKIHSLYDRYAMSKP